MFNKFLRFKLLIILIFLIFLACFTHPASAVNDTLIIGVKQSPPFIFTDENGNYTGLCIDIWKKISDSLRQPYLYKEMELQELLGAVRSNELDLSIVPLTVTPERMRQFYFSQPFFISTVSIAINRVEDDKIVTFLTNLFSIEFLKVIILLFVIILVFGILIWIFERKYNHQEFRKGFKGLFDGIWWASVTMTTVGYGDKSPSSFWGRFFSVIWMFTAVIIISSFTATISSTLTVNKIKGSIEKLSDLKHLKVGTIEQSSSADFLTQNGIDFHAFSTIEAGLDALQSNKLKAFVYDKAILDYYLSKKDYANQLSSVSLSSNKEYFSFAAPETTIIHQINPFLVDIIESENWSQMLKKYGLHED
ncbi:MAG: transporter substrate-binding domain-containing protein [Bacteroidetes bacterium]|jgi:polar amino acid transport system substrate-binding protein|nr:transporter substrate-binding domain-containing protein [Bacteroidota bacterium]